MSRFRELHVYERILFTTGAIGHLLHNRDAYFTYSHAGCRVQSAVLVLAAAVGQRRARYFKLGTFSLLHIDATMNMYGIHVFIESQTLLRSCWAGHELLELKRFECSGQIRYSSPGCDSWDYFIQVCHY